MQPRFEQFIRERQYLTNVSPATLEWYKHSFKWLRTESPTEDELKDAMVRMREKGLKATGCNSAIRAINAYLHWSTAGADVKCSPACKHLRVAQLKEPQLILPTFTTAQVARLANWKPKVKIFWQRRLHLLILVLLDTGCRVGEAWRIRVQEVDFDNLFTLDGKGGKQRVVPFSFELRRALFRYIADFHRKPDNLVLATRNETKLGRRVMLRAVKNLCDRPGFLPPARTLHAFRHCAAYLVTRYWTESELSGPPRVLGNKILEPSFPCSLIHAASTHTVGFAKGVQRSFRPFPWHRT
jgi:integrase/recombinase XerD